MASNLQGLPNFEVVGEPFFIFALHGGDDCGVGFVKLLLALLVVLADAGMCPVLSLDGLVVLIPTEVTCSGRLANIDRFGRARASVAIDTLFFSLVGGGSYFAHRGYA